MTLNNPTSDGYLGPSLMRKDGTYLGKVENPYLNNIGMYENSTRWVGDIEYTSTHDIMVFSFSDTTMEYGTSLGISDFAGTYYKVLTIGYQDSNPTYNPINNCVYFERKERTESGWKQYPIMRVSVDSKEVNEFFKASNIEGVDHVHSPNF